jgi:hypothetical protein
VPAQVDQPQWLVRLPDDSLASLEQERWAGPLRDELRQALLEQLGARFGVVEGRSSAPQAGAPVRVALELRRFDSIPGREARLEALWNVTGGPAALRCTLLVRETAPGGMPELGAAHRRARRPSRRGDRRERRRGAACRGACLPAGLKRNRPTVSDGRADAAEAAFSRRRSAGPNRDQGRTTIWFLTDFTPLTFMAMLSAVFFSTEFFAKPESITSPLRVSTLIAAASTFLSSIILALTWVLIAASSM